MVEVDRILFTMNAAMKSNADTRFLRAIEDTGDTQDFEVHIIPSEIS